MLKSAMFRAARRLVATLTLLGLLAVQGTVAAHPCAALFEAAQASIGASPEHQAMADCAGMHDKAVAGLCAQHCGQGHDANTTFGANDVPQVSLNAFLTVETVPTAVTASTLAATRPAARSTSPPPLRLSQRLRL